MGDDRRTELLTVINYLEQVWQDWRDDPDAKEIDKRFVDATADCIEMFRTGTIPADLRTLHEHVETMAGHWAAWVKKYEESASARAMPGMNFWASLEAVVAAKVAAETPTERTLEPIEQLTKQGVPDAQICKIYGFTDNGMPTGQPILKLLHEERTNPGTHTDRSKGWLPPWEKARRHTIEKQSDILVRIRAEQASKMRLLTAVAKETIEELLALDGISGKQICRMKKISRQDLEKYCCDNALTIPPWDSPGPANIVGDYDPDIESAPRPEVIGSRNPHDSLRSAEEEEVKEEGEEGTVDMPEIGDIPAGGEPMTMEQEIVMYHKTGMNTRDIAVAMSRPGNEMTWQKVSKVLKRYEKDPTAFEPVEAN